MWWTHELAEGKSFRVEIGKGVAAADNVCTICLWSFMLPNGTDQNLELFFFFLRKIEQMMIKKKQKQKKKQMKS